MATDENTAAIRLNVLGHLTIVRTRDGKELRLPQNARTRHVLALLALEATHDRQELVGWLWPHDLHYLEDHDEKERERVENKLDKVLGEARDALQLSDTTRVIKSRLKVVYRNLDVTKARITSDYDEFQVLMKSADHDDLRTALSLVRGKVAAHLSRATKSDESWLARARNYQESDITDVLYRLHPEASDSDIEQLCQDVISCRYRPRRGSLQPPRV